MVEDKKEKQKLGLNDEFTGYWIDEKTMFKVKMGENSSEYFGIMKEWLNLEKNSVVGVVDIFKIQVQELEIVKRILKNYFEVTYEDIEKKYNYNKISGMAITSFLGVGKGI